MINFNTIRNNFFWRDPSLPILADVLFCIDMDDGTSNYHVYNNVNLNCGIKFREGDFRVIENNIMWVWIFVSLSYTWTVSTIVHCLWLLWIGVTISSSIILSSLTTMSNQSCVWCELSNIDFRSFYWFTHPGTTTPWLKTIDNNCIFNTRPQDQLYATHVSDVLHSDIEVILSQCDKQWENCVNYNVQEWLKFGFYDQNSLFGLDPKLNHTNWKVSDDSPCLKVGFKNFDTNWGPVPLHKPHKSTVLIN